MEGEGSTRYGQESITACYIFRRLDDLLMVGWKPSLYLKVVINTSASRIDPGQEHRLGRENRMGKKCLERRGPPQGPQELLRDSLKECTPYITGWMLIVKKAVSGLPLVRSDRARKLVIAPTH